MVSEEASQTVHILERGHLARVLCRDTVIDIAAVPHVEMQYLASHAYTSRYPVCPQCIEVLVRRLRKAHEGGRA